MGGYYRLKEFGARLEGGARILSARDFQTVEAATDILEAADARAREIEEEARRAFESEKQRGYQEGLRRAETAAVARLVSDQRLLDQGLRAVEGELAILVESCVRKLVFSFDDTARAEAAVRQALGTMRRERRAELRVPPSLLTHFRTAAETIRAEFPEIELIDVVEDESLDPDQVIVESAIGRVDAHLGRRMQELRRLLLTGAGIRPERLAQLTADEWTENGAREPDGALTDEDTQALEQGQEEDDLNGDEDEDVVEEDDEDEEEEGDEGDEGDADDEDDEDEEDQEDDDT